MASTRVATGSSSSGNPAAGGLRVGELEKLSVDQLKAVKEQTDLEVNLLQDSLNNIRSASARLDVASSALQNLSLRSHGQKMLVPLTASLYVPGTLEDADKVLVDVGTGYFIEVRLYLFSFICFLPIISSSIISRWFALIFRCEVFLDMY